ncbi:MAG: DNA polymerase III subunit alpha [Bacteroidia bacterium]|nr:DNA polymerase III subunit alpha [Bacteroidia bacterium]
MYLNCHTYYSFKYGAISPEQLLAEAKRKGTSCLALTDINNTSGILDFFRLAPKHNVKPVAGIDFRNRTEQKFIGIAKNHKGFHELNKFLSQHLQSGEPMSERAPEFENTFIIYPASHLPPLSRYTSGQARRGEGIEYSSLRENEFIGIHPKDFFQLQTSDIRHLTSKLVVLSSVTFRNKTDFNTHRLLRAIDKNTLLSKLDLAEQAQPDEIMHSPEELKNIYRNHPQLISNTGKLLDDCEIDFEFGKNKNKKYFTGNSESDYARLQELCDSGLQYRYPTVDATIISRVQKEIDMIREKDFASYFLINHDIVKYAQHKNYFYVGRGSGANSVVAYLLRITDVDPIDLDLYFERFINPSRINPPDFDIDFSWADRDDVIDYIFNRSSCRKENVALLATYSTFQKDSVVRELGKVFGLPKDEIDLLKDRLQSNSTRDSISKLIFQYSNRIHDLPSHLSIHAGGILISEKPMTYYTALDNPPKGFPLTQFSMLEAEDVGLYKFDILSQRGLGKVKDAVDIVKHNQQIEIDIHDVKRIKEDRQVSENLRSANLIGCFYVESPAMRMLLTKLKASTYLDLVAASSIIRPGVAQSGMMREYIERFHDSERRKYIHPMMKELMAETFGVMVYQEDVIKVAHHFAKLSLTEADMLRRGMSGKYRGREEFKKVEKKFFTNCKAIGYPDDITKEVWRQIESFAGYAFSKGHSASYAVESYQCMFLKTYYPLEFIVAVLNNGGGFYAAEFYVHEARMCGGKIHAHDINLSMHETTIYGKDIYLGYNMLHELETKTSLAILEERISNGNFSSLENFMKRVSISVEQLRILIRIGAFRFTGRSKKQLLWDVHSILGAEKKTKRAKELFETDRKKFHLPKLHHTWLDDAWDEMEILGFPLRSPFELIAPPPTPPQRGRELGSYIKNAGELKNYFGKIILIIGYSVTRKRTRTKKGEEMCFGTFLDQNGNWIDTTHFPNVLKQFPFTGRGCYIIKGKVVEEFGFYSLDVTEMKRLDYKMRDDIKEKDLSIT